MAIYECDASGQSRSGQTQKTETTLADFRSGIAALGTGYWQVDFALQLTWWYLYLVEFADWDGQTAIGLGNCDSGEKINTGGTDSMTYHTGRAAGTDGKVAVQYRNIENIWGNVSEWRDGIFFDEEGNICTYNNPADFKDKYNGAGAVVQSNKASKSDFFIAVAVLTMDTRGHSVSKPTIHQSHPVAPVVARASKNSPGQRKERSVCHG